MHKEEFKKLFLSNAHEAIKDAERKVGMRLDNVFDIELHGGGVSGKLMSIDDCLDIMYLNEDEFYRLIDIGVKSARGKRAILFVRISAHPPGNFEETWNTPKGNGPFKVIEPVYINITS